MRVILEQGDKPEVKELVRQLQKLVPGIVIIEDKTQQEHRLLSDDEIREAILSVMPFFSVRSQWVAVYRILVDYYGFPEEVTAFCNRISKLMRGTEVSFTIDYQSVEWHLAETLQPVAGVLCQEGRQGFLTSENDSGKAPEGTRNREIYYE